MRKLSRRKILGGMAVVSFASICPRVFAVDPYGPKHAEFTIVVTDPLALPLACSCVQGYAQRKYEKLADYLQKKLGKSVRVVWGESIANAKSEQGLGKKTIFIGKDSVVRQDTQKLKVNISAVAQLTDINGSVNQRGVFVVRRGNPAVSLIDLEGYRVLWGPDKCDEKSAAPKSKLKELEIETSGEEVCETCSVAAKKLVEDSDSTKVVGVISSYAEKLLTGCGTIEKGSLRIIGESDAVPFISVFVSDQVTAIETTAIIESLSSIRDSKELLEALESKSGFVAYKEPSTR
jgi:ABC-type phosphate/phosphonate transport system substrate-binding protein